MSFSFNYWEYFVLCQSVLICWQESLNRIQTPSLARSYSVLSVFNQQQNIKNVVL